MTDDGGASVSELELGAAVTGQTSTAVLHLTNHGHATTGTLTVTTSGDFALDDLATTCQGIALAPQASCDIEVVFRPTADGMRSGELMIVSDPGNVVSIPLVGIGVAATLTLDPAVLDLGATAVSAPVSAPVHVTNTSAVPAPIERTTATGAGFTVASTTCGPTLAAGATCDVVVSFTPASIGIHAGSLAVRSGGTDYTAQLGGTGTTQLTVQRAGDGSGTVTSVPAGIDCGSTCTAAFSGDVVLTATPQAGSLFAGWSQPGCTGATCTIALDATPHTITASFTHQDVYVSPSVLDFGTVSTQNGPFGTLQLVNASAAAVSIDAMTASGPFAITGTTCGIALAGQASCDITVRFLSNTVGPSTGMLDVTAGGQHRTAQLKGTGELPIGVTVVGNGSVVSSPAGIDCGATCSALFSASATLIAVPAAGYVLGSWSTCGAAPTCDAAPGTTVTATFVASGQPNLSVAFVGDATGQLRIEDVTLGTVVAICTASCSVPLTFGDTIRVVGATVSTYGGLTGACTASASVPSCQFQAAGALTLATHFTKDSAERWTRFVPSQAMQLAFDDSGDLLVVQAATISKLAAATGAVQWSTQLAAQSFVVVPTGMFVTTGTQLVFVDANGVAQAPVAFTGTVEGVAPNGDLIGHTSGGVATEWNTMGQVVRTLPFQTEGIDSAGTFYDGVITVADEGGDLVTRMSVHRWAFDGTPLADIVDVAAPTANANVVGFSVGALHLVGFACGHHIPQTRVFSYASYALDGSLEFTGGDSVVSFSDLGCQAVPAGPDVAHFEQVVSGSQFGFRVSLGWETPSAGGWSSHAIVHPEFDDPAFVPIGINAMRIAGGPHGEVVLLGTYTGIYNPMTGQYTGGGTYLQTFYP